MHPNPPPNPAFAIALLHLHWIDAVVLFSYLAAVMLLGSWLGRHQHDAVDYFLGGRRMPWWAILLSIVATETSTVTFLSVPGITFQTPGGDLRFLQLAFGYILGRLLVVVVLLPLFFRGEIYTVYELLAERFGGTTRRMASLLFIVTRTLADGLRLYLTALVLGAVLDFDLTACVAIIGVATVIYTLLGGVRSVIWNDCIQFTVYMIGAVVAGAVLVSMLPGGGQRWLDFAEAHGKLRFLDFSPSITSDHITLWSGLIGGAFLSFATHGADQLMVQRYLTAKSRRAAGTALALSGFVVFAQFALFLLIGVGLAAFYAQFPTTAQLKPDEAFITFIVQNVSVGVVGIILAAVFSAAMSTLSSSLNSSAAALVNDFCFQKGNASADSARAMLLGRIATLGFGIAQMAVAIGTDRFIHDEQIVTQVLAIAGFTTGLILGLYLLGLIVRQPTELSALVGFGAGLCIVSYVVFGTNVSWPWYTVVGSLTTLVFGWLTNCCLDTGRHGPTLSGGNE